MTWTTTTPTVPGHYWCRPTNRPGETTLINLIANERYGLIAAWYMSRPTVAYQLSPLAELDPYSEWYGPIEVPT